MFAFCAGNKINVIYSNNVHDYYCYNNCIDNSYNNDKKYNDTTNNGDILAKD